ncbi:MAG TPA: FAD-binding oxidoreductase [Gemmatimonadaceae bacterium]|nr:FAD-binding oxidoreductase [Gemmatimonadaceae bacterium]
MNLPSQNNVPVWDDLTWRALAPQRSDVRTEVCVIGLGGSGLTAVSELLDIGRSVVGIDAADVAAGAAGRNGGFLLGGTADFHHDAVAAIGHARAVRIHQLTLEEIRRIADQAPGTVRFPGSLRIAESDEEFADCARQRDAMRADGIPVEDYSGPFGRGLYFPGDASFNPLARCRALALSNIAGGARLFSQTRALSFGAHEVVTEHGAIHCDQVIVAVDGRLESLVPELAGGVRTARLQMLATAPTTEISIPCPVYARYGFDYFQQTADGSVALGGGRDKSVESEWTADNEPSEFIQNYLERILREKLGVQAPVTHRWAASVSYTTNGLPVLAEVRPGVWAIGGYSGTGNAIGALCGRAAARLASGGTTEFARLLINAATPETH